ncbi:hypothetical protein D9M70_577510 [compost metagenome]
MASGTRPDASLSPDRGVFPGEVAVNPHEIAQNPQDQSQDSNIHPVQQQPTGILRQGQRGTRRPVPAGPVGCRRGDRAGPAAAW